MRRGLCILLVVLLLGGLASVQESPIPDQGPHENESLMDIELSMQEDVPYISDLLSRSDGFFTENLGQMDDPDVLFYSKGMEMDVYFKTGSLTFVVKVDDGTRDAFDVVFEGADPVVPTGFGDMDHRTNFLFGKDRMDWTIGAKSFKEIMYLDLWDGIDLVYRVLDGKLKYDFIIGPGVDASRILIRYDGIVQLLIDDQTGDLNIRTPHATLRDMAPIGYQRTSETEVEVQVGYSLRGDNNIGFDVGSYSRAITLVIDPGLEFSTFLGGASEDTTWAMDVDSDGNIFLAGYTISDDFPTTSGAYQEQLAGDIDIFITKIDTTTNSLSFATYIGGVGQDTLRSIRIDGRGFPVIAGDTTSSDFPISSNAAIKVYKGNMMGYVLRLDKDGDDVLASTYIGGDAQDGIEAMAVGDDGSVYVCGPTNSTDLPVSTDAYKRNLTSGFEILLMKLNRSLTDIIYCTYIESPMIPTLSDMIVDHDGNAILVGAVQAFSFAWEGVGFCNTYNGGGLDAFVIKMDPRGSNMLNWTFVGGYQMDFFTNVLLADDGSFLFSGWSDSMEYPTTPDAYQGLNSIYSDAVLTILDANLTILQYSTYFATTDKEYASSIALGPDGGTVYIGGATNSSILPVTPGCFDPLYRDSTFGYDCFVAGFNMSNRSLIYCSYIGGSDEDYLIGMVCDEGGRLYLGGKTMSSDFPVTGDAIQADLKGFHDTFTAVLDPKPSTKVPMPPSNLIADGLEGKVILRWDPPAIHESRLIKYRIYRGLTPDETVAIDYVPWYRTNYDDTDIPAGRYYYRVSSINTIGEGPVCDWVVATPWGLPGPSQNLTASTGDGSVTLTWDPPITLEGENLEYRILRGFDRDELAVIEFNCEQTSYVDDDVEIGTFYYYAVAAINQYGVGVVSEPVRIKPFDTPSRPMSFNVIPGDGKVVIQWGIPNDDGGTMITGYRIFRGTTPENIGLLATLTSFQLTFTDTNVTNGQTYIYYIVAFSRAGDGDASNSLDAIPFGLPLAPIGLVAEAGDGTVHLSWETPLSDGGRTISKYIIYWGDRSGDLSNSLTVGNKTTFDHRDLTNGVTYYYQVLAMNEAGEGPVTDVVQATPMGDPSGVRDLSATLIQGTVQLTWKAPSDLGGATSAVLQILRDTNNDPQTLLEEVSGVTGYNDTNVVVGSTYFYRIRVVTDHGEGPTDPPVQVTVLGLPGPVTGLSFETGNERVHLQWLAPTEDGGSPILGYIIMRGVFETALDEIGQVDVSMLNYTDETAENGKSYFYRVYAMNAIGNGERSEAISAKPLGPPGSPGVLEAKAKGGSIVLSWIAPTGGNTAAVTGYKIYRGESEYEMELLTELGLMMSYTDGDVKKDRDYYYKVIATSDSGDGDFSRMAKGRVKSPDEEPGFPALGVILAIGIIATVILNYQRRR